MLDKINTEINPFIISRTFFATQDFVWRMWTEPDYIKNWWGPKGTTIKYSKIDLREGGTYHYCMISPEGLEMWGKDVFREIRRPSRLEFVDSFSDQQGGLTRHPVLSTWPLEILTTVSFMETNGKTTITVERIPMNANKEEVETFNSNRKSMNQGWSESFDRLEAYLSDLTAEKEVQFFEESL